MTDSKTPRDSDGPPSEPIILSTSSKTLVPSAFAVSSNGIACEAITVKLTEVSKIAESLDIILKELQETLDEEQDNLDATATSKCVQPNEVSYFGKTNPMLCVSYYFEIVFVGLEHQPKIAQYDRGRTVCHGIRGHSAVSVVLSHRFRR